MAGSLKWFKYTTATGDTFGVFMDESNGEAVGNTDFGPLDSGVINYALPRNLQPRRATYRTADGTQAVSVICTEPSASVATLPSTITLFSGAVAGLTQFVGEVYRPIPIDVDTGLTDGDAT